MKSIRKIVWKIVRGAIVLIPLSFIIVIAIAEGCTVPWTGFAGHTTPTGDFVPGKTLWDWMELLIIPVVLAIGAFVLNRSERAVERQVAEDRAKLEREISLDRQQEAALQAYIDRISELLLKKNLRTAKKTEARDVARTRTISVMRGLDTRRNKLIIQFLSLYP